MVRLAVLALGMAALLTAGLLLQAAVRKINKRTTIDVLRSASHRDMT